MSERTPTKLLTGVVVLLFTFAGFTANAGSSLQNALALIPIAAATVTPARVTAAPPAPAPAPSNASVPCNPGERYQTTTVNGVTTTGCVTDPQVARCQGYLDQIILNSGKVNGSTLRRAAKCSMLDTSFGAEGIDADEEDFDEESENSGCAQHLNSSTCPEENAGLTNDFRTAKTDAQKSQQEAERTLIDAEEDWNRAKQESQNRLNEISDGIEDAGETFQKNGQKLLDDLESKIQEQDNDLKQLMNQMRAQYNKWDEAYVEMRDAFRAAEMAIAQARYNVEALCRGEAQQRLDETNKRIRERTDGLVGKKVNQSTTRVAGGKKRRSVEYERLRQTQYAEAYRMCMGGESPAGAQANNAIKTAKDNFERAKAKLADQQAVIENQRRQMLQQYEEAQQGAQKNKDRLAQQADRIAKQQYEAYQKALKRAERNYSTEMQQIQQAQSTFQRRQSLNYQSLSMAQQEFFTASTRLTCAQSNGGSISASSGTRRLEQYNQANSAFSTIRTYCSQMSSCATYGVAKPAVCDQADALGTRLREGSSN